ncbi:hypothetical protein [Burkholderia sp. S171]|uniref:terminase small subunit-like protein n=1 Tax=Burkholderia sp. S171 TaxID=1641860 RepID=UPI00131A83D7|nr:hypothetical protein [Burkholderia sp. S171]
MIEEAMSIPLRLIPDSTIQLILENIARGDPVSHACGSAGVAKSGFYRWLTEDSSLAERYGEALKQQTRARYVKE